MTSPSSVRGPEAQWLEPRRLFSFYAAGDYLAGPSPLSGPDYSPPEVVAVDLNGDGHMDLAISNWSDRVIKVALGNGDGTFGAGRTFASGGRSTSIAAGDFDGDGNTDLVTTNQGTENVATPPTVLLGNGDGTFRDPEPVPLAAPEPTGLDVITSYYATDVAVADADSDGTLDLLFTGEAWWNAGSDSGGLYGYVAASLGLGDGGFVAAFGTVEPTYSATSSKIAAADLDTDGKVDLVTHAAVHYGLGDGTFTPGYLGLYGAFALAGGDVTVADFDGDGRPDVATANDPHVNYPSSGGNVLLNNGNRTFRPPTSYVSGVNPGALAAGDFDGDGRTDLVTVNVDSQQGIAASAGVCLGNGDGTFRAPLRFAASPTAAWVAAGVAVADFNLDGAPDLAVLVDMSPNLRVLFNDGNWSADRPATVAARHVFYNRSAFDGGRVAADAADDAAIATGKAPLLPGQTASFAKVTSYDRGINGVMVDLADLPPGATPTAADFGFGTAGAPVSVTVRRGAGVNGSDRVTLVWRDYDPRDASPLPRAVANGWLTVTVKANANTGLASPDVFSFGNLIGDTGDSLTTLRVNALDLAVVKRALNTTATLASTTDINRDGRVDVMDLASVRQNLTRTLPPPSSEAPAMRLSPAARPGVISDDGRAPTRRAAYEVLAV